MVIGTVGTEAKAAIARAHGCDHPIVYTREDFVERVRALTGGEGVCVVYDSMGRTTSKDRSAACAGAVCSRHSARHPAIPSRSRRGGLGPLGSIYLTHPSLPDYTATRGSAGDGE